MTASRPPCVECGSPSDHDHHVVPRSLGGTFTVPLCGRCHGMAHGLAGETWTEHRTLTRAAMRSMRERLLYTGGRVRYGYRVTDAGELVPDDHEQAVLSAVRELHAAGLSLRRIGAELDARGLRSRSGAPWGPSTVRALVASVLDRCG